MKVTLLRQLLREEWGTECAEWALMVVVLAMAVLVAGPPLALGLGGASSGAAAGVRARAVIP